LEQDTVQGGAGLADGRKVETILEKRGGSIAVSAIVFD
jgi:hypothetical protein